MRNKLLSVCLVLWIVCSMQMTAFAAEFDAGRTGSISITLVEQSTKIPVRGAEFSLYHVASSAPGEGGDLSYTHTEEFKDFAVPLDDPSLIEELDAYVGAHSVTAEKKVTDYMGMAVFGDLPLGVYFVQQTNYVEGYAICKSFLIEVPDKTSGAYTYNVKASPKTEPAKFTDITIKKVWDVDEFTEIADYIEVELLRNGAVVKTAALNEMNNWTVTFTDMLESDSYSIIEVNVPEGFAASYTQKGYKFIVTNRLNQGIGDGGDEDPGEGGDEDPGEGGGGSDDPSAGGGSDDPALIQTGQIVWPIPVLAIAGMFLITVGAIILRRTRGNNE